MRYLFTAILGVALVACSSNRPAPVKAGDLCFRCNQVIGEPRLGAQLVTTDGQVRSFKTPGCLAKYLKEQTGNPGSVWVTDYPSGEMVSVANAIFVRAKIDETTGERDFYAYKSATEAAKHAKEALVSPGDWALVRTLANSDYKEKEKPKKTTK